MAHVVHAACPHDCPDACGVLVTVENGRATHIKGDPAHPVTRGFLCAKVSRYLDRVYSPDRLLYPMKRIGPKGPAKDGAQSFVRVSWDEALDTVTTRIKTIASEFGPEAILPYSYGGTLGVLNNASMDRRFFHRLGASQLERTICSSAGGEGLVSVTGKKLGTEPEQFRHSRYIIAWAGNIHGNNIHLWPFVEEARRNGAKLVVIDPYRTRTAKCADWYLPINPNTDGALAMAMMHVIIGEELYNAEYVAKHTLDFEQLGERVRDFTPEVAAGFTGISPDDIRKLAREYATTRPAVIRANYGLQRGENGGMALRAIAMLPCITGSWAEVGGGLLLTSSGAFGLNRNALERPDLMEKALGRPARSVNMSQLGSALAEFNDPPIKALFVYNSNPAAVAPDHNRVIRGLLRDDLFTVVHEQFLTDTCDYADIVLPATTFVEHKDLVASYGTYYLQVSQAAMDRLGECKSNVELFAELAQRMDLDEPCFSESVDDMIDLALNSDNPWLEGITRERLEREGHARLSFGSEAFVPFANGFATSSGKAELYSEALASRGLDPVVAFVPPTESRHVPNEYPLEMLTRKADNFVNSTFANIPAQVAMEEIGVIEMHPVDATARGIRDGDRVRVYNGRGEMELTARVNNAVQPGVVAAKLGWAKLASDGRNVNVLTSERLTDIGAGATFYACMVDVARI